MYFNKPISITHMGVGNAYDISIFPSKIAGYSINKHRKKAIAIDRTVSMKL